MSLRRPRWQRVEPELPNEAPEATDELETTPTVPESTYLHPDCELEGRLRLTESIRIEGEFRGALESDDTVTVGENAAIEASIRARAVIVHGAVVGDVRGSREVVLHPSARLQGSIETPSLVIERGAVFTGQTRMYRPDQAARSKRTLPSGPKIAAQPEARS